MEIELTKTVRLDQLHQELSALVGFTGLSIQGDTLVVYAEPAQESVVTSVLAAHVPQPTAEEQARAKLVGLRLKGRSAWAHSQDTFDALEALLTLIR